VSGRPDGDHRLDAEALATALAACWPSAVLVVALGRLSRFAPFPTGGKKGEHGNGMVVRRCALVERPRWAAGRPLVVRLEVESYR